MHSAQMERFYTDSRQILSEVEALSMGPLYSKAQYGRNSTNLLYYRTGLTVGATVPGHKDPEKRITEVHLVGPRTLGPSLHSPQLLLGPERVMQREDFVTMAVTYDDIKGGALAASKQELTPLEFPSLKTHVTQFVLNFHFTPADVVKEIMAEGVLNTVPFSGVKLERPLRAPIFTKSDLPLNEANLTLIESALDALKRRLG